MATSMFLNVKEAAELIGMKPATLNCWRSSRQGPPYFRMGGRIKYDRLHLENWVKSRTIDPEHSLG